MNGRFESTQARPAALTIAHAWGAFSGEADPPPALESLPASRSFSSAASVPSAAATWTRAAVDLGYQPGRRRGFAAGVAEAPSRGLTCQARRALRSAGSEWVGCDVAAHGDPACFGEGVEVGCAAEP